MFVVPRPEWDQVMVDSAHYAMQYDITSTLAYDTARTCLIDTLGYGLEALEYPACTKLLGPVVPGTVVPYGAPVPGTKSSLDTVKAAFDLGAMLRWLDFYDNWLGAAWGQPSTNMGAILATDHWLSRSPVYQGPSVER